MRNSVKTLRELLRGDSPLICCAMGQLCDPKLVEMIGNSGNYQAIWFDQEHVGWTVQQIEQGTRPAPLEFPLLCDFQQPIMRR